MADYIDIDFYYWIFRYLTGFCALFSSYPVFVFSTITYSKPFISRTPFSCDEMIARRIGTSAGQSAYCSAFLDIRMAPS